MKDGSITKGTLDLLSQGEVFIIYKMPDMQPVCFALIMESAHDFIINVLKVKNPDDTFKIQRGELPLEDGSQVPHYTFLKVW